MGILNLHASLGIYLQHFDDVLGGRFLVEQIPFVVVKVEPPIVVRVCVSRVLVHLRDEKELLKI